MTDLLRQEIAALATTVVVKVGTRVLTHPDGTLDDAQLKRLATDLHAWKCAGRRVVLVSSGAVGAGMSYLGWTQRPTDLSRLQAVAAIGQTKLIEAYDRQLRQLGTAAAQVLLTADDLHQRTRYLNVRNTLLALLELGTLPIINENDTVAVDELMMTFGDNDHLAALVTNLLRAPLLIILSDVEGLYDGWPKRPDVRLIPTVAEIDERVMQWVEDRRAGMSKGGMASKLRAARIATAAGENVIIASGRRPGILPQILAGEMVGTLFLAQGKSISPWKRWIGFSARPKGKILLDGGAQTAIVQQGRSLLAVGIVSAEGDFTKGDIVAICDPQGRELARGLTNYSREQLERIRGRHSREFGQILGAATHQEVVHRDNLVLVRSE